MYYFIVLCEQMHELRQEERLEKKGNKKAKKFLKKIFIKGRGYLWKHFLKIFDR